MECVHKPIIQRGGSINRLLCTCGKLDLTRTNAELLSGWQFHLRMSGVGMMDLPADLASLLASAEIQQLVQTSSNRSLQLQGPSATKRRSSKTRGPRSGWSASRSTGRQYTTGPLSQAALDLVWGVIWPTVAEGSGFTARDLAAASYTQRPCLAGRRYLALTFCRYIPGSSQLRLAQEIGISTFVFASAERQLPAYLARFPELVGIADELGRATGIALPRRVLQPAPGRVRGDMSQGNAMLCKDQVANVAAVRQAVQTQIIADRLAGAPTLSRPKQALVTRALSAAAASVSGDIFASDALKQVLADLLGVERSSIYRAIKKFPERAKNEPLIAGFAARVVAHLRTLGIEVQLPPTWAEVVRDEREA